MNNLFLKLKNLPLFLSAAFFFTAGTLIIINLITLIPSKQISALNEGFNSAITALFAFTACVMINWMATKNTKKAVAAGYCVLLFDAVLFTLCAVHISFILSIVLSLLLLFFFEKYNLLPAFCISALISFSAALVIGLSYDLLFSLLKSLCDILKGRGALFGAVSNVYSLLFSENLSKLFYHKDYSGTAFVNSKVVSGVIDVFKVQKVAGLNVSKYLSGKYFVNIFVSTGLFLLLYQKLEKEMKTAFVLCFALAFLFGDVRLLALFVLVYNPIMYFGYLLLIIVSYLTAYFLDIRIAFLKAGSLFELFKYIEKPVYFIITGLVIMVLTYFIESLILSKFDFHSKSFLPRNVKKLIDALGGRKNIEKLTDNMLYVKNPNLINILNIDCDIKGNAITLHSDELELIKEYV